jgi:hypothetical protein
MNLKMVNNALDHKIYGGSEFQWACYGSNARYLDFNSQYGTASIVFDTETQNVYEASVYREDANIAYRYIDPNFIEALKKECTLREEDFTCAWDGQKYIDLEVEEDWLEKANAIFNNKHFDTRIQVPIELDDETFLMLAMQAHKRDVTINNMVEIILVELIENTKEKV